MVTAMNSSTYSTVNAYKDNTEPRVEELLSDPIMHQLMRSDNVAPEYIARLQEQVNTLRQRLGSYQVQ